MRAFLVCGLAILSPAIAFAQDEPETTEGTGAVLRAIDTINGKVEDLNLKSGEIGEFGRIRILLKECRYPSSNPFDDAFALLDIREADAIEADFSGWMLASSPALNALEHPRYDVWVINCIVE